MELSYSQAAQDLFVLKVLNYRSNGIFLEIGSNDPIKINNTYLLEKQYGWTGIMVEQDANFLPLYKEHRPNSEYIIQNAVTIDYNKVLEKYPRDIEYLQIDLDVENFSTLNTLLKLNDTVFKTHRFAVITFEHDVYKGDYFRTRDISRMILKDLGYVLLFPDVSAFEDWWVHPELVDPRVLTKQLHTSILHFDVLKHLDNPWVHSLEQNTGL